MNETMTPPPHPSPPRPRRRWLRRIAGALLLLVAAASGGVFLLVYLADREWDEAVAEADRLDPGWRFDELEKKRAVIPDDTNSARQVLKAYALRPNPGPALTTAQSEAIDRALRESTAPLSPAHAAALAEVRTAAAKAVAATRMLKDMPAGRFTVTSNPVGLHMLGEHREEVRQLARLLEYDILLRQHESDADGALESCRALVNLARSCGDAPDFVYQLQRSELRVTVCRHIERTLAQGRPSAAALEAMQRLLEDEEAQPLFLHGARGFRANLHETLDTAHVGKLYAGSAFGWAVEAGAANMRPAALRMTTAVVEAGKLPVEQLRAELDRRLPKHDEGQYLVRVYIWPKIAKVTSDLSRGQVGSQAQLRCTIVLLAAERYRQATGRLPDTFADLVPAQLLAVPTDPDDGRPLRYQRRADGVVIYSDGTNLGVQLWTMGAGR
jgi:hypothetical protein